MKELIVLGTTQCTMMNKERISPSKGFCKSFFCDDNVPFAVGKWRCIV